jgi:hypothetical protein
MEPSGNLNSLREQIIAYHREKLPNNEPGFAADLIGEEQPSLRDVQQAYFDLDNDRVMEAAEVRRMMNRYTREEWLQTLYRLVRK